MTTDQLEVEAASANGSMTRVLESEFDLVLTPGQYQKQYWADLWRYRELFFVLAWRDVSVRYKQTVVGIAWAVARPLLSMIVFTIVFERLAKLPSDGEAPYALMVYSGMIPWFLFSTSLSDGSNSLVTNVNLVSKVYFPRMIVPVSTFVSALVDFLISFVVCLGLMVFYSILPAWQIVFLPIFVAIGVLAALGPALLISSLNVKYRDFRYVIPFIVQLGLYVSPVGFSSSNVPDEWRLIYSINPMVGVIDGFRWCLLGGNSMMQWDGLLISLVVVVMFLWLGTSRFRAMEKSFADFI